MRVEHADENATVGSSSSDGHEVPRLLQERWTMIHTVKKKPHGFCEKSSIDLSFAGIANIKIAGMNDDLQLRGMQYNIALTVFFVPYALFELSINIVLNILRPSIWISVMLLAEEQ
ncbi:uncharacterized protein PADG_08663 [Paracoccidioides brasiliensis Pb18]|uniref:Uncharacterized protein n=1 Tax=Paracoccidioides brasiliensis (strain Pb18) TaxID=502780 RepID=C1GN03_PARBD|nr:uncharacterized protein PADG_08663 [Paracoccidioides brasiliensis Pb18]EEH45005.2 hypothetical protein PADG_08663 [Paracoccidioides brasiliensis Pb18]